jgi:hypothetical protein
MAPSTESKRREERPVRRTFTVREQLRAKHGREAADRLTRQLHDSAEKPKRNRRRAR